MVKFFGKLLYHPVIFVKDLTFRTLRISWSLGITSLSTWNTFADTGLLVFAMMLVRGFLHLLLGWWRWQQTLTLFSTNPLSKLLLHLLSYFQRGVAFICIRSKRHATWDTVSFYRPTLSFSRKIVGGVCLYRFVVGLVGRRTVNCRRIGTN